MSRKLVLVGGASGSGKSTFVKYLKNKYNCDTYRRLDAFKDCAIKKGYNETNMFNYVSSEEADSQFISFCVEHDCIVSDIHYALQRNKDFASSEGESLYVATLSDDLIKKLLDLEFDISAVLIQCDPEIVYFRMFDRFNKCGRRMRSKNIEEVIMQSTWERKMWEDLFLKFNIRSIELNSGLFTPEELVEQFLIVDQTTKDRKKVLKLNNNKKNNK